MAVLTSAQRSTLERTVIQARKQAETGARNALQALAVNEQEPFAHQSPEQRSLRNRLRTKARLLGDELLASGKQEIAHLAYELAYEYWHKMLFAQFLESNGLLIHPDGVAVTMEECEELAAEEGHTNKWAAAARYASTMLPAIFRVEDPLMQVEFAPNDRISLESLIENLDHHIFTADDALGWVYQFWQSEAKAAINASGDKIDGAKLPAVTQLFTEPYMVHFLIDNTLGAWWVSRNPGVTAPIKFEYLRVPPASSRSLELSSSSSRSLELSSSSSRSLELSSSSIPSLEFSTSSIRSLETPSPSIRSLETPSPSIPSLELSSSSIPSLELSTSSIRSLETPSSSSHSPEISPSDSENPFFAPYEEIENLTGNLPHWRQGNKLYFVTFRAADSLPQELLKEWEAELEEWKNSNPEPLSQEQKKDYYSRFPAKMQQYLDSGYGACLLARPEIMKIVENALRHFDNERYLLDEFAIAANHVHVVLQPLGDHQLSDILHSWKSFTANEINKATGTSGTFWQKESYDHIVRNEKALERIRQYIRNHKVSAASSRRPLRQDAGGIPLRQDAGGTMGNFEGWPDKTAHITSLDPCMGSGHFVASLFTVFVMLRMHEEGLSKEAATDCVIAENLHGLELDPRCTQIAAFNLALTAWKFCGHYKPLPEMNLACSGIAPKGKKEDWVKLVGKVDRADDKARMENGMRVLYDHFQLAPELGSLLDPSTIKADAFCASFEELQPVLVKALEGEADKDQLERGVMAAGIAKAGQLLAKKFTFVITNVPYLGQNRHSDVLSDYCKLYYKDSKPDIATVFIERIDKLLNEGLTQAIVSPQNWLFQTAYKKFRFKLLSNHKINTLVRMGGGAFSQIGGEVVKAILIIKTNFKPNENYHFSSIDISEYSNSFYKNDILSKTNFYKISQKEQLSNPDFRIKSSTTEANNIELFSNYCYSAQGIGTTDNPQFVQCFWEQSKNQEGWVFFQTAATSQSIISGYHSVFCWEGVGKKYIEHIRKLKAVNRIGGGWQAGSIAWRHTGFGINVTGKKLITLYSGEKFDTTIGIIIVKEKNKLLPIFAFLNSTQYIEELLKIDQGLSVTEGTLIKVPFDLEHWQKVAAEKYPDGLPKPYSDDATQWLFHGHPAKAETPLQVAFARLLGYRWPAENDTQMELADEARQLIAEIQTFDHLTDEDGILCIPSVNGEMAAAEALRTYLQAVWGSNWHNHTIEELLKKEGSSKSNLEDWLREEFFVQHCKVFQNRPFIWHIWDGRKDGFGALVNYHKLTKESLQKLIFTYLGDWIRQCESRLKNGESGADGQLSAARKLKEKLELILEGEKPYDVFVRWKKLEEQPIGWNPDLNDGVRLNIRPFIEADVLRKKPNIKWGIDRGKNPPDSPWGEIRDNDKHLSLEEKREVREK